MGSTLLCSALTSNREPASGHRHIYSATYPLDKSDDRVTRRPEVGLSVTECAACGTHDEEVALSFREVTGPIIQWVRERCLPPGRCDHLRS